ncbi:hypothetical protein RN001_016333 [Aquatica leii]|uniref:Death domain-containing protein n=1 Tax=Aquatica leii TaxID=1421715 RepID=A0AAN7PN47_9COLE|nr:hypothetical protein RN001_016333 [Aquatica leii]
MCSNNVQNENFVTDAEPSPDKEHDPTIEKKSHRQVAPEQSEPQQNIKTITNVINISNAQGVHIGPKNKIYLSNSKKKKKKNHKLQSAIPKEISKLMCRNDPLSKDVITLVATHIGENWRSACRSLDYSDGQIYQFEEYYHRNGVKEIVNQILTDWTQNKPQESTIGALVTALWYASETDVIQRLTVELSQS